MSGGTFLYPNVTSIPSESRGIDSEAKVKRDKLKGIPGEFDQVFDQVVDQSQSDSTLKADLNEIKAPLKFSAHASQRLKERKIALDTATLAKVNSAVDKAAAKGVEDTLVITPDAALIVSVKNRTVITALDKGALSGNVFTNIDGAVII